MNEPKSDECTVSDTATHSHSLQNGSPSSSTSTAPSSSSKSPTTAPSPSDPPPSPSTTHKSHPVPIHTITTPDPKNARLNIDPNYIEALAADIRANGLLHPITLARTDDHLTLVAGNNRLLAAKLLGWTTIDATEIPNDPLTIATIRLAENFQRADLSPLEEATQLAHLVELHPRGVDGAAEIASRRPAWVLGRLELLDWPPDLQAAVHTKHISMAAAAWLARIQDPDQQARYIRYARDHGITAATASLWFREAQRDFLRDSNPSQFCDFPPENQNPKTGKVVCALCREQFKPEAIVCLHACNPCRSALETILQPEPTQSPPEQNTPPSQPPPPHNDTVFKLLD